MLNVAINMVESVFSSYGALDMLIEFGQDSLQVCMQPSFSVMIDVVQHEHNFLPKCRTVWIIIPIYFISVLQFFL